MQTSVLDGYLRRTTPDEQLLYDYLLKAVQQQLPRELLDQFRHLFIDGYVNTIPDLQDVVERIIHDKMADYEFKYILNRCCHILINRWQMNTQSQWAIPELVSCFEEVSPSTYMSNRSMRRLRSLVKGFTQTEQYLTLQRLARVIVQSGKSSSKEDNNPLSVGNLINRYPYLYEHCLLSEDSGYEHKETVRQIQAKKQHTFELDLSQYVTYQVRLAQIARQKKSIEQARLLIPPIPNPTLLTDRDLGIALKQFVGKVHGNYSYRDLSHSFLRHTSHSPSYYAFKEDLFRYLIMSIDPKYGNIKFNKKLYNKILSILPQCDDDKLSELLIMRTTSQLLNFLTIESAKHPDHYIFVDLITNLGATSTVALLLKVALICRKVKPYLEKRFSILFSHYESCSQEGVPWLIQSLENLHIAFSVHFGSADLSCLNHIM